MAGVALPVLDEPRASVDVAAFREALSRPLHRRNPLRPPQPGPLLHRCQRLPDRAARRRAAAHGGGRRRRRCRPVRASACRSRRAAAARRRRGSASVPASFSIARSTSTACWRSTPPSAGCAFSPAACSTISISRAAPLGLQFAPDISTANRATIGGMIANNSSGTHSVIHGKTIDHVLELRVVLADGSVVSARPLDASGTGSEVLPSRTWKDACYRVVASAGRETMRRRSSGAIRRSCAASAATTSIALRSRARHGSSTSRISSSARKGRWASSSRRSCGWSSCRKRRRCWSCSSPICSKPWRRRRRS